MKTVRFGNRDVPVLGQGTWTMGDKPGPRAAELAALRRGIDLGMTVIDTAEMYGSGRSESVVGAAMEGRRDAVYLVSKVLPSNASAAGVVRSCEASLQRLRTDALDLYLLHWRGRFPLAETLQGFQQLQQQGKIRDWGVSNFDVDDMEELFALPGGDRCAANQVLYNPEHRGIEFDLLPWLTRHGVGVMAYSPVGQGGGLLAAPALQQVAAKHGVSTAQVALAWCLQQPVQAIPKAGTVAHVEENAAALTFELDSDDLRVIDTGFPAPKEKVPLATL